jgi:prepilin-type N-terminal cleavage/methylation domain-containing protein
MMVWGIIELGLYNIKFKKMTNKKTLLAATSIQRSLLPRGFTLIELLIVVAIVALLASIILISLTSARNKSRIGAFKSQAKAVQSKAMSDCIAGSLTVNGLGGNQPGYNISDTSVQSCGVNGNMSFTLNIDAIGLIDPCRATAKETGIILFNGC